MAKGIFTAKIGSGYDDIPEIRYHFPKTYLNKAKEMVGDWVIYYEPKKGGGRGSYFATAMVERIEEDKKKSNHFYAFISNYIDFDHPVPFRLGDKCIETALMHPDGELNRGSFQRSIRLLPEEEYKFIVQLGFVRDFDMPQQGKTEIHEDEFDFERPFSEQIISRPFRDAAFTKKVRTAYDSTCAMTGLKLINGGGRCEIEAAHIKPVGNQHKGPDSVRNGLSLSRTVHWMFDRGVFSITDDFNILMAEKLVPDQVKQLINPDGMIKIPDEQVNQPHPQFLQYHREVIFKG
jgi:putative restriction endonuclease